MTKDTVCFAYRLNLDDDPFMTQKADMFALLRKDFAIEPVVSFGGEGAIGEDDEGLYIQTYAVDANGLPSKEARRSRPNRDIQVLVNRTRWQMITQLPTLNPEAARRYGCDKVATGTDIFEPNGMGILTIPIASESDVTRAFDTITTPKIVLKKVSGSLTEGLFIEERSKARHILTYDLMPGGISYLLQPAYDFTVPWASSIRPYTQAEAHAFTDYTTNGKPKELRVYFFYRRDTQTGNVSVECFPVRRTSLTGEKYMQLPSTWFGVDPDSLPAYVLEKSAAAGRTLGSKIDAVALYGCIDWGYGAIGDGAAAEWVCIEGNFRAPYLLSQDKHSEVGPLLYRQYAQLIRHLADN